MIRKRDNITLDNNGRLQIRLNAASILNQLLLFIRQRAAHVSEGGMFTES